MSFNGTIINKLDGGLGGGESSDRVAVIVVGVSEASDNLQYYTAYELLQLADAEKKGITEEHDITEGILAHYHLSEVFRLSPETSVHLITVPADTEITALTTNAEFITALRSIDGINTIGVAELSDQSIDAAVKSLQLMVDKLAEDHIYIDAVLVEGKGTYLTEEAITDYSDLRAFDSENISVVIGQDTAIAKLHPAYLYHAAVGSALGMLLVRAIHENLGSVDIEVKSQKRKGESDYPLTDVKTGRWLSANLSNGKSFDSLSLPDQKKLDSLGYIYVGKFSGYGGYFFSDSHTCTESDSDYCYIERNAIWNKAARIIRDTLIPRIRSKVQADPATGYIKNTTITDWDGRVRKALEAMTREGNVADFDIYINPNQAAVSQKPFNIKVQLVADGIVHEFEVDLGFTTSI